MKNHYSVEILELKEVHEIPGAWTSKEFKDLLDLIEYDDVDSINDEELKDMAIMALSDLDPDDATDTLLQMRFGVKLNKGQRQNLIEEMQDEKIWEEYSEIAFHEELFNVSCILYWAFPKKFSEPDIVKIKLLVTAQNKDSFGDIENSTPSFVARILNDGMDERNIIYRLFDEQLAGESFPEAEHIIWKMNVESDKEKLSSEITVYTSWNWVDELKGVKSFDSEAHSD